MVWIRRAYFNSSRYCTADSGILSAIICTNIPAQRASVLFGCRRSRKTENIMIMRTWNTFYISAEINACFPSSATLFGSFGVCQRNRKNRKASAAHHLLLQPITLSHGYIILCLVLAGRAFFPFEERNKVILRGHSLHGIFAFTEKNVHLKYCCLSSFTAFVSECFAFAQLRL